MAHLELHFFSNVRSFLKSSYFYDRNNAQAVLTREEQSEIKMLGNERSCKPVSKKKVDSHLWHVLACHESGIKSRFRQESGDEETT